MRAIRFPLPAAFCLARPALSLSFPLDVLAADGRPLMENRSLDHAVASSGTAPCPYPDFRRDAGNPINVGALHAFNRAGTSVSLLIQNYGRIVAGPGAPDLLGLWRFAKLPIAQVTRHVLAVDGGETVEPVPAALAALYKVCRGLHMLVERMCDTGPAVAAERWSPESLLAFVDAHKLLLGRREACAAPRVLIERVLRDVHSALASAIRGDASPQPELEFAGLYAAMERFSFLYAATRSAVLRRLGATAAQARPRPTFAGVLEAAAFAEAPTVQQAAQLRRLGELNFSSAVPELEECLNRGSMLAMEVLVGPISAQTWAVFFEHCFLAITEINSRLRLHLALPNYPRAPIQPRDVDAFFGQQPQFV